MMKIKNKKTGLTLVELLIVITIIGLLASIFAINVSKYRSRTRDSQRVADIRIIQQALAMYQDDSGGSYPICDCDINGLTDCLSAALSNIGVAAVLPVDPLNSGNYVYHYCSLATCTGESSDGDSYYIKYYLETNSIQGKSQGQNFAIP